MYLQSLMIEMIKYSNDLVAPLAKKKPISGETLSSLHLKMNNKSQYGVKIHIHIHIKLQNLLTKDYKSISLILQLENQEKVDRSVSADAIGYIAFESEKFVIKWGNEDWKSVIQTEISFFFKLKR